MLFLIVIGIIILYILNDQGFFEKQSKKSTPSNQNVVVNDDHFVITNPNEPTKQPTRLSRKCPHLGCNVNYKNNEFVCPCHNSRFNIEGHVLEGPATSDLAPYN